MIEKIEILHHRESSHLGNHSCKETFRLLCIVAYHHKMVVQPIEEVILTVNAKDFGCEGKSHYFQIGECRGDTATSYVPLLIYSISCELFADFKDFSELFKHKYSHCLIQPTGLDINRK